MNGYDLNKPILKEKKEAKKPIILKDGDLPEDINYIKEQIELNSKTILYIKKKK